MLHECLSRRRHIPCFVITHCIHTSINSKKRTYRIVVIWRRTPTFILIYTPVLCSVQYKPTEASTPLCRWEACHRCRFAIFTGWLWVLDEWIINHMVSAIGLNEHNANLNVRYSAFKCYCTKCSSKCKAFTVHLKVLSNESLLEANNSFYVSYI